MSPGRNLFGSRQFSSSMPGHNETRKLKLFPRLWHLHARLFLSFGFGAAVALSPLALPWRVSTRVIVGWDAGRGPQTGHHTDLNETLTRGRLLAFPGSFLDCLFCYTRIVRTRHSPVGTRVDLSTIGKARPPHKSCSCWSTALLILARHATCKTLASPASHRTR